MSCAWALGQIADPSTLDELAVLRTRAAAKGEKDLEKAIQDAITKIETAQK